MKITIKYYGSLRKFGFEETYQLQISSVKCRIYDVMREVAHSKDKSFTETIYDSDGTLSPHITIILNRKPVINDQEKVPDGSTIKLLSYVAGG